MHKNVVANFYYIMIYNISLFNSKLLSNISIDFPVWFHYWYLFTESRIVCLLSRPWPVAFCFYECIRNTMTEYFQMLFKHSLGLKHEGFKFQQSMKSIEFGGQISTHFWPWLQNVYAIQIVRTNVSLVISSPWGRCGLIMFCSNTMKMASESYLHFCCLVSFDFKDSLFSCTCNAKPFKDPLRVI